MSYSVSSLGTAIADASKALQDCKGMPTQCKQNLGNVVSILARTFAEAFPAAEQCHQKNYAGCALSSIMPALNTLSAADNVEQTLRSCVHKRDGPAMLPHTFSCVADVAGGIHDVLGTVSEAATAARFCKKGQRQACDQLTTGTVTSAGLAAMRIAKAAHTCKGKNTACAGALGSLVENLGEAAMGAIRAKSGCAHGDAKAACATEVLLASTSVMSIAKDMQSSIHACHKSSPATVVV
jgi:hypothetical protein